MSREVLVHLVLLRLVLARAAALVLLYHLALLLQPHVHQVLLVQLPFQLVRRHQLVKLSQALQALVSVAQEQI